MSLNSVLQSRIKLSPQEFFAAIIEFCIPIIIPLPGSEKLASALAGLVKGIQKADFEVDGETKKAFSTFLDEIKDKSEFNIPIELSKFLDDRKIDADEFVNLVFNDRAKELLSMEMFLFAAKLDNFDVLQFNFEAFADSMIEHFRQEALKDDSYAQHISNVTKFSNPPIYCANWMYVNSFITPMFLHKGDPRVCLKNLYVMPKCKKKINRDFKDTDIENEIKAFLNSEDEKFLFIEGDAGTGKTTLAAWLNYHHAIRDETAAELFVAQNGVYRSLLTVRLRDLERNTIKEDGLCAAVAEYTNAENLATLENLYPNAVIILDGFDELCMLMQSESTDDVFTNFSDLDSFKYIVTSRPKYIRYENMESFTLLRLLHFNAKLRKQWLDNYKGTCGQEVSGEIEKYILTNENQNILSKDDWNICNTPMTLYMVCAKKQVSDCLGNMWQLYNRIFKTELSQTEYNRMFPNSKSRIHDIDKVINKIYRISEEIAYKMYMGGNAQLYVSRDDVSGIINKLKIKKPDERELLERCYALCCYWKADSSNGAAEFLHNNIRDFFLAEKIYREAERIINGVHSVDEAAIELCRLFQYGALEDKVCEFIYLRAKYNKEKREQDFASVLYQREREQRNGRYSDILLSVCKRGLAKSGVLIPDRDISDTIVCILRACVQVFRKTFEAHRDKRDKKDVIDWSQKTDDKENDNCLGDDHTFLSFFDRVMRQSGSSGDFSYMDLSLHNLSGHGFSNSIFKSAYLRGAYLRGADLRGAHLNDAYLERADLERARLEGARLERADLIGAYLNDAHLEGAHLEGARLIGADLIGAHLNDAYLEGADLRGACLEGATLPDGYHSYNQKEQIEHLKSLNIEWLTI